MEILGIGNAIVDVICKVEDEFISKNSLTKSTMKLIFDDKIIFNLTDNINYCISYAYYFHYAFFVKIGFFLLG